VICEVKTSGLTSSVANICTATKQSAYNYAVGLMGGWTITHHQLSLNQCRWLAAFAAYTESVSLLHTIAPIVTKKMLEFERTKDILHMTHRYDISK